MRVFKFGGASVKDANGMRNLVSIVNKFNDVQLLIVVSAIGKTTNALEKLLQYYIENNQEKYNQLDEIKSNHMNVLNELFGKETDVHKALSEMFDELRDFISNPPSGEYDYIYDQIVSYGELLSTRMVSGYMQHAGIENEWIDIRNCLKTDETFRDANILWEESAKLCKKTFDFGRKRVFLTQGFIGSTFSGYTTTLGREGSDYTAAIMANILDGSSVTIWKDVPGLLNADPKWMPDSVKLSTVSYQEAIELAYFGAKVIHPKTIKPLQNKGIPLFVKSFIKPDEAGSAIEEVELNGSMPPCFIRKENQLLITLSPKDLSFVMEESISRIFALFHKYHIKVNLIQTSAVSFSVSIDENKLLNKLIEEFSDYFSVKYNRNLELITIRHYTPEAIYAMTAGCEVLVEQKTRHTCRFVLRKLV